MHLSLLLSIFIFLTAFADQENIDPDSSNALYDNEFDPVILADANTLIDPNNVPDNPGDSMAVDPCGGTPSSESSLNTDTALGQAWIDNTKKSRRDLGQDFETSLRPATAPQPGLCRTRGDQPVYLDPTNLNPTKASAPNWAKKCKGRYSYDLCCAGTPRPFKPTNPWKRAVEKKTRDVDECIYVLYHPENHPYCQDETHRFCCRNFSGDDEQGVVEGKECMSPDELP